ncbi:ABC transporter permease [Pseudemcibacter aquimaris]|uniref:ABC transporter permease n=1 Tax=Pseudemcibacter aquimaris TaxID=2857064 RepID=UPI0020125C60|nr:ABC transporter permease subunit [Pseudemcibacter aquimaris]MCC3862305.1 ABC transporter permease subunit [Pseudemcibacter aquimaris]WDU59053.1 ABC transporter permease subunit [Pseudemcibacter aquimaris]
MLNGIFIIAQKEIKDALRDPGAMIAAILYTVIGPALLMTVFAFMPPNGTGNLKKSIDLVIDDKSTEIARFLEENNFILDENSPIKVIVPNDIDSALANGEQRRIVIDADLTKTRAIVTDLRATLEEYNNEILRERLKAYDLTIEYIEPIRLQTDTVVQVRSALGKTLISMISLSFFMAIAFTGMSLSIDMTAGERERMTLEPLLAQPVSTLTIISGKWLTSFSVAMFGSAITATLLTLIFMYKPEVADRFDVYLNGFDALKIYISLIPLCAMFAALQVSVALFAKSYKEGIYYLSLSGIGPMTAAFMDPEIVENFTFLPLLWEANTIRNIATPSVNAANLPNIALLISIVFVSICLYYAQRRLKQETMLK